MEGKSRAPEITIAPVVDGGAGAVDAAKAAGKEPMSPGTPSAVATGRRSNDGRADGSVALPGWKLDALCQEHSPSPAMRARFLFF
ncbi:hypothetical protein PR202_ga24213 [Eleusine coracana subsp. coracana]|uniref:Uncharacterized protein n=1 Tax=Eleusine coracana subsp. coracana TaxID=191504 RepID=A0AAV5D7S7_ELECO|nr:hypothetical protein QOZ80_1BG0049870 [Eleusine coracana subsp. coracana]GJN06483.1 hypothetical protein PR202_ga24213 [Eleusine coracana subsp. coracana]